MTPLADNTDRHLQKLAALVTQRRVTLEIRDKRVAAKRCGLSVTTYTKVEVGQRVTDTTYAKIELGFGIRAGSCKAVIDGSADSITLEDGTELIEGAELRKVDADRLTDALPGAVTKSAIATAPGLTGAQMQAISEGIMEELQRLGIIPPGSDQRQ
ncbi:hypothetical protein ABZX40_13165 [Streptomyces sp. NPDC004610]|uniref:hypothetical protein n=1 Tax=unclassified Streptomyces TaxID=2593676 RepID=UPI00339F2F8C